MKHKFLIPAATASVLLSLGFTSCQTAYPGQATGAGAGVGAVSGALIGAGAGGGRGALIGAGAGLLAGALIGAAVDADQERYYHAPPGGYPYAERTATPGYVYSPYGNHSVIDVRGVPRGSLVRDPSTGGVFRKP
jgi:zinc transporter ZupT